MATTGQMIFVEPYRKAVAITLHDSNEVSPLPDSIYIGGAGNLKVTMSGTAVTLSGLLAGSIYPVTGTVFWSTGSTVTNVMALYR